MTLALKGLELVEQSEEEGASSLSTREKQDNFDLVHLPKASSRIEIELD